MHDQGPLARWARLALYFTMTTAVLYGLLGLATAAADDPPGWMDSTSGVIFVLLMVGGVSMGLLYLARLRSRS